MARRDRFALRSQLDTSGGYISGTAYRLLYVDSAGVLQELAHGTSGQVLTSQGASADPQWATPSTGLANVVEDTTPQLGGSLDVNGNTIVSTSAGNISLQPDTTGNVVLGTMTFDADQTIGAGQDNYVLTYDNATGLISLEAAAGGGGGLNDVVDDLTPQLGGSLDVNGQKIVSVTNGNIDIEPNGTGNVLLGNFTFDADQTVGAGQDNYVLTYDNATGLISLEVASGGGATDHGALTGLADDDHTQYILATGARAFTGAVVAPWASGYKFDAGSGAFLAAGSGGNTVAIKRGDAAANYLVYQDQAGTQKFVIDVNSKWTYQDTANPSWDFRNDVAAGTMTFTNDTAGGTEYTSAVFDDVRQQLYYNNALVFDTNDAGIRIFHPTSDNPNVQFLTSGSVRNGFISFNPAGAGQPGIVIENEVHGANILLRSENVSGTNTSLFEGDPDGSVTLYYAGNAALTTISGTTIKFGTHSAIGAETVTGYITIQDSGGTTRKLAVVS